MLGVKLGTSDVGTNVGFKLGAPVGRGDDAVEDENNFVELDEDANVGDAEEVLVERVGIVVGRLEFRVNG